MWTHCGEYKEGGGGRGGGHAHKSLNVLIIRSFLSFILRQNQGPFSQCGSIYNTVTAKVEGNWSELATREQQCWMSWGQGLKEH